MDAAEFHKLALAEIDAVHRLAYRLAPRPDQADDLVQETYVRAFKYGLNATITDRGLRPYLFKILHNVLNTRLSREMRQPVAVEDLTSHASPHPSDGQEFANVAQLDWDTIDERLKQAIDELPLAHRTVFLLCAVEQLRYREIADVVQVPVGTVMSRLHRAREILTARLADLAAERRLNSEKITTPVAPKSADERFT